MGSVVILICASTTYVRDGTWNWPCRHTIASDWIEQAWSNFHMDIYFTPLVCTIAVILYVFDG